ncbi:hypothetical protein LWI28_002812 [Acer negundo]|uniref:RRM domain-containing protein n=1 Tax=Acer negundo TaxID=4023 RepID=A0AAD5JIA6_ACENE|nr:hypothetical protein LWI28_002812 [Acer negundo]
MSINQIVSSISVLFNSLKTCLVFSASLPFCYGASECCYLAFSKGLKPNINSKDAALGISEEASWHAKYKDSAYVYVGGIPFDLTEGDLLAVFAQPTGNGKALETHPKQSDRREEKSSRRHDNVENSREDHNRREEKRSRQQDTNEFKHDSIEDHDRREEKRSRRHTDGEFELRSGGDHHWREENRSRRHGDEGEFERRPKEEHDRREEKRLTRRTDGEFELRSGGDPYRREENRPRRHCDEGGFERKPREDHNRREEKRPTRRDSESYVRDDRERRGEDKWSTQQGDSSSYGHK